MPSYPQGPPKNPHTVFRFGHDVFELSNEPSAWDREVRRFEKRLLQQDGVRHAIDRLAKNGGVDPKQVVPRLMITFDHIRDLREFEASRDKEILMARKARKQTRRRLKDLAPSAIDFAHRVEEAAMHHHMSTLM